MRALLLGGLVLFAAATAWADTPDPPISEARLPVSTLVREDIFAGWMEQDMERYARAEKNIEILLEERPKVRAETLAWKGGTKIYRAVLAREAGNNEECEHYLQEARDLFAEAKKLGPKHPAVAAIVGGSYVLFGDRLPEAHRAEAWTHGYDNYKILWEQQGKNVENLPLHIRGELLAGMAQSSERTGRTEELTQYLDKIIEVLPDTGYAKMASEWKADPAVAASTNISCKSCHSAGRLASRMAKLAEK